VIIIGQFDLAVLQPTAKVEIDEFFELEVAGTPGEFCLVVSICFELVRPQPVHDSVLDETIVPLGLLGD
jgi:hypothetical protein